MAKVIKGAFPETVKPEISKDDTPVASYILHVSITFSDPLIWRRVQVPGRYTLSQLHDIVQRAMGWTDSHVHQFLVGKISYEPTMKTNKPRESKRFDEHKYQLHSLEEGMQFMFSYIYDAGEGWEHVIHLEEVVFPGRELPHPFLLAGEHSCPPEEVGDVHEYNRLVTAFETPDSSERHSLAEFSENPEFDPAVFNFEEAKRLVSKI